MELADKTALTSPLIVTHPLPNGDTAFVRSLSGKQRQEWIDAIKGIDGTMEQFWFTLIQRSVCAKEGALLFAPGDNFDDIPRARLEMLYDAAREVNGLVPVKSEEDAKKN